MKKNDIFLGNLSACSSCISDYPDSEYHAGLADLIQYLHVTDHCI